MIERRFYEFGRFRLDAAGPLLFRGEETIPLPPKAANTLLVLVQNAGQVVDKDDLLRQVWEETFVEEGSLTRTISILRKSLGEGQEGQEFIATLPKRGYRFVAKVRHSPEAGCQSSTRSAAQRLGDVEPAKEKAPELIQKGFRLTERICRKLNRATLDPLIICDGLRYADNQVDSDVLVFFLHGLGLDHRDFEEVLKQLPYRGISPTLYGCEPGRRGRISLSLADHVIILRELLREIVEQGRPAIVVLVGFSMGADMGFELLLGSSENPSPQIDAFLSLECNLNLETCVISRVLENLAPEHPEISVNELRRLGDSAKSLDEWLNIQEYLVRVLRKFQGDIGVLQGAAADLVRPFRETPGFEVFVRWVWGARKRVRALRLVFPNDLRSRQELARLRLENLDTAILGEFPDGLMRLSTKTNHFDLMSPEEVLSQVEELVAEVRAVSSQNLSESSSSA